MLVLSTQWLSFNCGWFHWRSRARMQAYERASRLMPQHDVLRNNVAKMQEILRVQGVV